MENGRRIAGLASEEGAAIAAKRWAFAIDLVAHVARQGSRRVVTQLVEVAGYDSRVRAEVLVSRIGIKPFKP